eukprot:c11535_g1_i1.p1 GENE.c11535_g1_i1~~c11535_g1_i1.p1  ORF type:complete len:634 (-),score=137.33 c11535_g1_i1:155-1999(-)
MQQVELFKKLTREKQFQSIGYVEVDTFKKIGELLEKAKAKPGAEEWLVKMVNDLQGPGDPTRTSEDKQLEEPGNQTKSEAPTKSSELENEDLTIFQGKFLDFLLDILDKQEEAADWEALAKGLMNGHDNLEESIAKKSQVLSFDELLQRLVMPIDLLDVLNDTNLEARKVPSDQIPPDAGEGHANFLARLGGSGAGAWRGDSPQSETASNLGKREAGSDPEDRDPKRLKTDGVTRNATTGQTTVYFGSCRASLDSSLDLIQPGVRVIDVQRFPPTDDMLYGWVNVSCALSETHKHDAYHTAPLQDMMGRENMIQRLLEQIQKFDSNVVHAIVFVHGFKTSFVNAAKTTAFLAMNLAKHTNEMQSVLPLMFDWPSGSWTTDYPGAQDTKDPSIQHFRNFLNVVFDNFNKQAKDIKVHVIAHSMGGHFALDVIDIDGGAPAFTPQLSTYLNHVIFLAPDVPAVRFAEVVKCRLQQADRKKLRLFASASDGALAISSILHGWTREIRAGSGEGFAVLNTQTSAELTSIDASVIGAKVDLFGHSYFLHESVTRVLNKICLGIVHPEQVVVTNPNRVDPGITISIAGVGPITARRVDRGDVRWKELDAAYWVMRNSLGQ